MLEAGQGESSQAKLREIPLAQLAFVILFLGLLRLPNILTTGWEPSGGIECSQWGFSVFSGFT